MDGSGAIYVTDTRNFTIRKLTPMGTEWVVTTIAGQAGISGSADGTNNDARFYYADALAIDPDGNLFVADTSNHTIRYVTRTGTNWVVRTIAGTPGLTGSVDGTNGFALFNRPLGITADRSGNLYVADNHAIRRLTPEGTNWITRTIAGLAGTSGYLNGSNSNARFDTPCGVAVDAATNIYVADFWNYVIRKITPLGTNWVVTTIAGMRSSVGRQDGTNSDARFWNPYGVAVGGDGVVYVSNAGNHTIRKITPAGTNWVVTTIGGLGNVIGIPDFQGNEDGVGSAARFAWPTALTVSGDGTVFVADYWNNTIRQGAPLLPVLGLPQVSGGLVRLNWTVVSAISAPVQSGLDLGQLEQCRRRDYCNQRNGIN